MLEHINYVYVLTTYVYIYTIANFEPTAALALATYARFAMIKLCNLILTIS